jgi:glutaredoxin
MKNWMLVSMLMLACAYAQADLYRWVDENGKIQYSDQPPPANIKDVNKIKSAGGKPGEAPLPYALQQAVKNFPVTLFSADCGESCTKARDLLAKRGIPYTDMDATLQPTQDELKKLINGPPVVPVLKVGREILKGFEAGQWNGSLDAAGYPKTAVIPARAPAKPPKPVQSAPSDGVPAAQSAPPSR